MQLYLQLWESFAIKVMDPNEGRRLFDLFGARDTVESQIGTYTFILMCLIRYVCEIVTNAHTTLLINQC